MGAAGWICSRFRSAGYCVGEGLSFGFDAEQEYSDSSYDEGSSSRR
jgi:hypothetical protein